MKLRSLGLALTALTSVLVASEVRAEGAMKRRVAPSAAQVVDTSPADLAPAALEASALAFVSARASAFGVEGVELTPRMVSSAPSGAKVVRFAQRVGGVPVLSGGVSVTVDAAGRQGTIAIDVDRALDVETTPSITEAEARVALADQLGLEVSSAGTLVVLRARSHGWRGALVWSFDVRDVPGGSRVLVDAHSGVVVQHRPLALHALGRVHEMNIVETPTLVDVPLPLLDEVTQPVRLRGWDGLFNVTNYVSGGTQSGYVLAQDVGPNVGADFLYDLPADLNSETDELAQVNLYFHMTHMRQAFEAIGVQQLAPKWSLTAVANGREDGADLNNAFFSEQGQDSGPFASNNLIVIGQGAVDFAYDSDVFKHEFGHYVSHNDIGFNLGQLNFDDLGISPWSGSIDEGIADYFACSDNDDPELGEGALGGSMRDLTDTSKTCPDDLFGEVHADGEVIGSTGWSIREVVGREAADRIVWSALSSLNPGADFFDFAEGIKAAADAALTEGVIDGAQRAQIDDILTARGLDTCDRIVEIDDGPGRGVVFGLEVIAQLFGGTCDDVEGFGIELPSLFHYSKQPAEDDVGIQFSFEGQALGAGSIDYSIYVRAGEPVEFGTSGNGLPEVDEFDYVFDLDDDFADVAITAESDPPFDPTQRYFAVIVSRGCPSLSFEMSAGPFTPSMGEGGAGGQGGSGGAGGGSGGEGGSGGGASQSSEDDGCDCTTAGRGSSSLGLGAVALGLAGLAGRRRRRASA